MKRKLIILFSLSLFLSFGMNAQTLSTDTYSSSLGNLPTVGSNFDVPIDIAGIGTQFTLTVYLEYDNSVLTYTGYDSAVANTAVSQQTANIIKILVGNFPSQTTFNDGKLVNLQFDYNGGGTDLTFHTFETGTYNSSYLQLSYSTHFFVNSEVTNGAVIAYSDYTISGGDWNTATNWVGGAVATEYSNVTVAAGSETTIAAAATANNVTIENGGQLSLSDALTVGGDFLIESEATGNGSFIDNGTLTVTGTKSVQSYVTTGQWHGISSPVAGVTANELFLSNAPSVWLRSYNEGNDTYTNITDLSTALGDMEGWMTWISNSAGASHTYTFTGMIRNGSVSNSLTKDGNGYNFVGNPYTSAIDWEAASGWGGTATVTDNIWVYDNGSWKVYNRSTHVGNQTQYIAMNQGFFVEASTAGTFTMTNDVCAHNSVPFRNTNSEQRKIALSLESNGLSDEAFVGYYEGATEDYDNFDAHKFFSFNENYPQIYSTANDFMAINSLPMDYSEAIAMDVRGEDGVEMTISLSESEGFDNVYLNDEYTGRVTDLTIEPHTFTYVEGFTDRFNVFFSITDVNENELVDNSVRIFAFDNKINVILDTQRNSNITVYNLLGQEVVSVKAYNSTTAIPVNETGYYVVKVRDGNSVSTQKVFIK